MTDATTSEVKQQDEYEGFVAQFSIGINDLRVLYQLLGKLPMEMVEATVNALRAQVTPQLEKFKEDQNVEEVSEGKPDKK